AEPGRSESRHLGGSAQQAAVAQIEAEHARRRRRPFPRPHHSGQVTRVPEGLGADDDARRADIARLLDLGGGGGPGVEPHVEAEAREGANHRPVISDPRDGVEVGDVAFARPESVHKRAGEGERLRRPGQHALHRRVAVTLAAEVLRAVAAELPEAEATAVTMTAELSDVFRTKREGVTFILDAMGAVTGGRLAVFTTDGVFVSDAEARARPLAVAASNWMATAVLVARHVTDALLVDIGTTTTDVVPIQGGRVVARGRTDPERLLAGELVYTGSVRTNVAAIVARVPLWGGECPVAAEYFAVSGDAHLRLGDLDPAAYTVSTPDGGAPTAAGA